MENFDSSKKENFDILKRKILTVWKGNIWQFENENFDSLKREILTVWKGKFWQFEKPNFEMKNHQSICLYFEIFCVKNWCW
jgi:hypothetical protein